jgi:DNA-binding CsgD family transcriptional regulator
MPPQSGVEWLRPPSEDSMVIDASSIVDEAGSLLAAIGTNRSHPPTAFDALLVELFDQVARELKLSRQLARLLWLNLWGYSDQEIADALQVSLHTVQDYQYALRRKTKVRSKGGYLRLLADAARASSESERDRESSAG